MTVSPSSPMAYPPSFQRWMITLTIMLVAVIEVLDMTIVNVALPPMMGSLAATSDQITWVLTSYIVSSAIFMLLTGYFEQRLGQQRLLLISISGFMITSMLCGLAGSLSEIVLFRTLQGVFGASLVPLSQTILRAIFPPQEHGKAMAIWGIGIMVAPILGPTLGGLITEHINWRWVFYINIPVCLISLIMTFRFIKPSPTKKVTVDLSSAVLLAVGIGCLQIFLDRGNSADWFQSNSMIILFVTCLLSLSLFVGRGINNPNNIIDLRIFLDKNFVFSTLMLTIFGITIFGIMAIQPILLENLLHYPTQTTGLIMAPRGIASAFGMIIVGSLISRFNPKWFLTIGLSIATLGTFMLTQYDLSTSNYYWITSGLVQGFGIGMFMVPLATLSLSTLPKELTAAGAGLFSFGRNLGSSMGISFLSTIVSRETQVNWNQLGEHINPYNPQLQTWLEKTGNTLNDPHTLVQLQAMVAKQASMIAFLDAFWIVGLLMLCLFPLIFILKVNPHQQGTHELH